MLNQEYELEILRQIEVALCEAYQKHPSLSDSLVNLCLNSVITGVKKRHGFAKNQTVRQEDLMDDTMSNLIELGCTEIANSGITVSDYEKLIKKIQRSVRRHRSVGGIRGYYDFVKNYLYRPLNGSIIISYN